MGSSFARLIFQALVGVLLSVTAAAASVCRPDLVELRGPSGQSRFTVELADTDETRARGLMYREHMPSAAGMLFIYDRPGPASFWMKNTLIPLDMIFVDAQGRVSHIHEKAVPGDLSPIFGGRQVKAVLEINGGLARSLGLQVGDQMRHPSFSAADAIWPCN